MNEVNEILDERSSSPQIQLINTKLSIMNRNVHSTDKKNLS